jgi:hypothetical protein
MSAQVSPGCEARLQLEVKVGEIVTRAVGDVCADTGRWD